MEKSIKLAFKEGSSDKVYHVELKAEANGYVVNFAYGRRGNTLNTGTKTATPVDLEKAEKAYDKLVKSKVAKGYKEEGAPADSISVVDAKEDVGIRPQLLNEIDEADVDKYLMDERYCMQEKEDGRRKMIKSTGSTVQGANKKGFLTPIIDDMMNELNLISGPYTIDGEDMGSHIRLFDMIDFPNMRYIDRYEMLMNLIPHGCRHLQVVPTAWSAKEKVDMFNLLKHQKAEGVVFKLKDAPYTAGRPASGGSQFKCKFYATASCVVLEHHDTKRSISVGVYDDDTLVNVGNVTVYPNQDIPAIDSVVEVKYLYFNPGGSLYQPVLKEERDDVDPRECIIEQLKTKQILV
jgi:bifunctional non-homologous end joining protein LigD